jgi:hypothetical protein
MKNSEFDYDPEKDNLSGTLTVWIIILAIGLAIYLSQILV